MKIMIHASNKRMHYVGGFLVPWLIRNGAQRENILVWTDRKGEGCLKAYLASYRSMDEEGDTWHLEDDVLPGQAFIRTAEDLEGIQGIMCGFGSEAYCRDMKPGRAHSATEMYYSFPCIRIPNRLIRMFLAWYEVAAKKQKYAGFIEQNKHTDLLFRCFIDEVVPDPVIYNLYPCLVEHVDDMLGGSLVNPDRDEQAKALTFDDVEALEELRKWRGA